MLRSSEMESKSTTALMRKKRKYGKLSLDQKVQIIRAAEMGYSQRTLASQYNCGKTQVHLLVTQKDLWLSKWERSRKGGNWAKIRGTPSVSEINSLVWDFYKKACSCDIQVSVNMLLERAKQVAQVLNAHNFDADYEWLQKFKTEFNINVPLLAGESSPASSNEPDRSFLKGYSKSDVYYLGVAELYYRMLPWISQKSQDHITVCFCVSASGDKEIIGLVFCENACVEGELWNVNVPCFSSPMGQVTLEVYQHSLNVFNQKINQLNKKILLYVDKSQFPSEIEKTMSNIEITPWPKVFNIQDVINNFRLLYCERIMSSLAASNLDNWSNLGRKVKSIPLNKVMKLLQGAWKDVSEKLIQLCFQSKTVDIDRDSQCQEINSQLLERIQKLVVVLNNSSNSLDTTQLENVANIAEEIFCQESQDESSKEIDAKCSTAVEDQEEEIGLLDDQETVTIPSKNELVPMLLRLELYLQSVPESVKRQEALDNLDNLERSIQALLITEQAITTEVCS